MFCLVQCIPLCPSGSGDLSFRLTEYHLDMRDVSFSNSSVYRVMFFILLCLYKGSMFKTISVTFKIAECYVPQLQLSSSLRTCPISSGTMYQCSNKTVSCLCFASDDLLFMTITFNNLN